MKKYFPLILLFAMMTIVMIACGDTPQKSATKSPPKTEKKKETAKVQTQKKKESKSKTNDVQPASDPIPKDQIEKAKALIESISLEEIAKIDAKKKYKILCSTCHGFKGNMMINGAKDLTISNISLPESVAQIYFGRGLMTSFNGILDDDEIVAIAKYTETLRK